jgi:LysM repeat protein
VSLPRLGPLALAVVALVVAALALFFVVPSLLLGGPGSAGGGGGSSPTATSSHSVAPSVSPSPAAPTPQIYIVHQGDTLSRIAKKFGVTVDEIIAANPTIKNPDKIGLGAQLVIPVPGQSLPEASGPAAASPSG